VRKKRSLLHPAAPVLDWTTRLAEAPRRLNKFARMGLSMFSWATAATGCTCCTWHMEHSSLPLLETLAGVMAIAAKLVNRGYHPTAPHTGSRAWPCTCWLAISPWAVRAHLCPVQHWAIVFPERLCGRANRVASMTWQLSYGQLHPRLLSCSDFFQPTRCEEMPPTVPPGGVSKTVDPNKPNHGHSPAPCLIASLQPNVAHMCAVGT
jgi:hypothetical protein